MKINKQKLVDLLVKKTGMDLESVEKQLNELIDRIQEAAEKGKALEIKGFGMFYFSNEGDLKFDPSEDLQTEVNYKYTGMDPVEIKKPRESSDKPVTESEQEEEPEESSQKDDIWGFDEGKVEEEPKKEAKDKEDPESAEEPEAGDPILAVDVDKPAEKKKDKKEEEEEKDEEVEEEAYDPFAEFDHGYIKPEEEKSKEEDNRQAEVPVEAEETADTFEESEPDKSAGDLDDIFPAEPEKPAEKKPADKSYPGKKKAVKSPARKKNPVFALVTTIVVILILIMGVIIASDLGLMDTMFGTADTPGEVTQVEPQPQAPVETGIDEADEPEPEQELLLPEENEIENGSESQEQPEPPAIEEIETPDTPQYGLFGTAEVIDDPYYSIILHSIRNQNRAQEIRDELQNEGYRSVITSVSNEELGTMWRVGIGQFKTIPEAQNAATELPQNYRDNHFIGLIQ